MAKQGKETEEMTAFTYHTKWNNRQPDPYFYFDCQAHTWVTLPYLVNLGCRVKLTLLQNYLHLINTMKILSFSSIFGN